MTATIKLATGDTAHGDRADATHDTAPTIARDVIAQAFDRIGGIEAFVDWIESSEDHRKLFYATLYPKLLTLQVTGKGGAALAQITRIELVPGDGDA
jgi:hypothetical protein